MRRRRVARNEPLVTRGAAARSLAKSGQQRRLSRVAGPNSREPLGLRERKKARLRQQIIDTSIRLFRKHGYENTRVEDIVQILEISQPTFFRYTAQRLWRMYEGMAREVESDRPLWRAVVLSGAMDPVRSPEMRRPEEIAVSLLREILAEGQKRGEITKAFPVAHLAEFMEGLYTTVVRRWAVDLSGPHSLSERVRSALAFFLKGVQA